MRRTLEHLFVAACVAAAAVALTALVVVVGAVAVRGLPAVSWGFLTGATAAAGAAGGVAYQLAGTLLLVAAALAVAVPLAVGIALTATVYAPPALARRLATGLYVWNGVPSILFGLFGLIVFVRGLGWGKSWLAGGLVLGLMILPTVTVALAERLRAVPRGQVEAAYALGLGRSRVVGAVLLPQSASGLVSGALLGLARAAGETAPILFTAAVFSGATLPTGVRESPVLALPYHIFVLAQDSLAEGAQERLWGAALVLLALTATAAGAALPARLRLHEGARHRG